ncbi:response regulator [Pseudomonas poae]|nr:response regulator [Pseudomonas poae]
MVISNSDSQPLELTGRVARVDLADKQDNEELTYLLLALGATVASLEDVEAGVACDLYFFDSADKAQHVPDARLVQVTELPILSGWKDTERGYPSLSSNPFMWGSLVYVCNELLGGCAVSSKAHLRSGGPGRPLILVAEDHPTNQALIKWQLDRLGFDCELAGNGSEALHQFNENIHCMLITDCYMPVMDGYTLAQKIRAKIDSHSGFPILAMTASVLVEEQKRCAAAGINACLLKPLNLDTLREAVNKWMPRATASDDSGSAEVDNDWQSLLALLDTNPELKGLISGFIETSEVDIAYMERLPLNGQPLIEQLHRLRGALRLFNLHELAAQSANLEQALGDTGQVVERADLLEYLQRVQAVLARMKLLV